MEGKERAKYSRQHSLEATHVRRRHIHSRRFVFCLLFLLIIGGGITFYAWSHNNHGLYHPNVEDSRTKKESRQDFDELMMRIFRDEVTDDSVTLNFMLKDPGVYECEDTELSLGHYSMEEMKEDLAVSENWIAAIETFDYDKLSEEQQLTYDIVYSILQKNMESSDLLAYSECLGATTGIQAQLPVLLVEYAFSDKNTVEEYIQLLGKVPDYFQEIIEFQKYKSKQGLFMSDQTAEVVIRGCEDFISKPEKNYMITTFPNRLKDLGLSSEEQKALAEENRKAVMESVIPAYQSLIEGLESLKGSGKNNKGLSGLKKGQQYYEYLVQTKTGSERSIREIDTMLEKTIEENKKQMAKLVVQDEVYAKAQGATYPGESPEQTIEFLKGQIAKDFPALPEDIHCQVKYVDPSMEETMSPAFYLTPAMDDYQNNVVYLNGSEQYDLSKAFTTLAHETYPGHLYQNCYFYSREHSPVRNVVSIGGYTEGWGTYAELYSYQMAGLEDDVQSLLYTNTLLTLALYAEVDLQVNYYGWTTKQVNNYLADFGFSKESSRSIFDAVVEEPASYMPYTLGYLEIENLREQAEKKLGEKYSLSGFHEFFLQTGPAPFTVLQDRLEKWITKQK